MFLEKVLAADTPTPLGTLGGEGLGPFARLGYAANDGARALGDVAGIVSSIIGILTLAAGIWFIFQFIIAGFNWMTASGDKQKLESARQRINDAFLGLIVVTAGWGILALASVFFGVNWINPETLINYIFFGH